MVSLLRDYNQLKNEYENYQKLAEETIQKQSMKITELDKKLDMLSLIVEISEYINKSLGNSEIAAMINDIMIGILGVTYSSVYLVENRKLRLKASNLSNTKHHQIVEVFNCKNVANLNTSLLNSIASISTDSNEKIHSSITMPIYMKDDILGLIIVEHNIYNYLSQDHVRLLTALTNQIAICLENNRLYNQIKQNSQKDCLTGLFNRKYFFNIIQKKIANNEKDFAIVMLDIDNFKKCNDTYGHPYGDVVIRRISQIVKSNIRKEDIVARYGGEELIIYMYDVKNVIDVYNRMEQVRGAIERTVIQYKDVKDGVTVSIGIALKEKEEDLEQIIRKADKNLYTAKHLGKNKVVY
ncbi:sensor domain-containing diguanylate cyclase [Clostridium sp. CX1]|uniref:sensor domain-containing diguanylate cyclase n=1 Tax=Clostridium sp. CX1 TaxID=2978346 RepID=UPI0021C0062F|nr:sensor domain-containing diguanylate cyclase [Clostridium sp. CX1]MCT8976700.1 sensor domain-containing diguanylate cyclase [Clostridium sp. CX1]